MVTANPGFGKINTSSKKCVPSKHYTFEDRAEPIGKDISHMKTSHNLTKHEAPNPTVHFSEQECKHRNDARQLSSTVFYPESDKFVSPVKREQHSHCQTKSSFDILGDKAHEPGSCAKKSTSKKASELGGSGTVKPLSFGEMSKQDLKYGSSTRDAGLAKGMGGAGATDAIRVYNDNDITSGLVNGKHTNPAIFNTKPQVVKGKPK